MSKTAAYEPDHLRDLLVDAAEQFGTLLSPRARLEHLSAALFLKRASDNYAEETKAALKELGGVEGAEAIVEANPDAYHALRIPKSARWDVVRNVDRVDLGTKLNEGLQAVATANGLFFKSVFDTTDFNNRQALPVSNLAAVVRHLQELGNLTNHRASPEVLGEAFFGVVDHFAHLEKPAPGEMFTPPPVARLGARLLAPEPSAQVHDPACGSAGLLLRVRDEARRVHGDVAHAMGLYGQERKPSIWLIARMNALFHGAAPASRLELADTVLAPAFFDRPEKFDLAICNPPFDLETNDWYEPLRKSGDKFGRINHLPPKGHPELVFVQHMVASLSGSGRMAVLLPNGALFRAGNEQAVRRDLVEGDILEAVIQLPKGMFYGSGIPVSYVLLNKAKPEARRDRVLFIDASERFERIDTFNILRGEDSDLIVSAFETGEEVEGLSSWAECNAIRDRRYNLTVRRYVRASLGDGDLVPLPQALAELEAARAEARVADESLEPLLAELRSTVAGDS